MGDIVGHACISIPYLFTNFKDAIIPLLMVVMFGMGMTLHGKILRMYSGHPE